MKIILIVEDLQEEITKAKKAVVDNGCKPVVANCLNDAKRLFEQFKSDLFGVVTDLHYKSMVNNDNDKDKPNGLAMVAMCVENNVRVAVCSDIDHHFSGYLILPLSVLSTHQKYTHSNIPYSEDKKDWDKSIKDLLNL